MKILMQPIEMVAWFTKEGVINPIRYRVTSESELVVYTKAFIKYCSVLFLMVYLASHILHVTME